MRNWTENQIKLALIRHGATLFNQEHRYLGKTDASLSEEGRAALQRAKCAGRYPAAAYVFASPMKRCLETAEILYPEVQPIIIPQWREMDFGAFEGKNYRELQKDERYQAWIDSSGTLPFPEGESREQFVERCAEGMNRMRELLSEKKNRQLPEAVSLIVHGGTIMALLSSFCGGDYFTYQVPNGGGYLGSLDLEGEKFQITNTEKIGFCEVEV